MTDVFDLNKDRTDTCVDYVKQLKWQVSYVFLGKICRRKKTFWELKKTISDEN